MPEPTRPTKANPVNIPNPGDVARERERLRYKKRFRSALRSTLYVLLIVAAAAVFAATVFLPVLQVSGTSMEPTLQDGDIILLVKTGSFKTGDIVGLYWQNELLLKRVIGTPGDIINIADDGTVTVNGEVLDEPYVSEKALGECDITFPYQVPESRCFVMGDHRAASVDSRSSVIGCIETGQILGRALVRVYPLNRISLLH